MLTITVPGTEMFDSEKQQFVYTEETVLELEHSLISLSKWESRFKKPFLSNEKKTTEETFGYIEAMSLNQEISSDVFRRITNDDIVRINDYIEDKQTATWFREIPGKRPGQEIITNEIIYYWMTALQIPKECENWHLNRLFTLLRVVNEKNKPTKKMSRSELASRNRSLNAARKAKLGTSG